MGEEAKGKPQTWTEWQLRYLLRNAGRIPTKNLCENLERDPAEVERVTARLRALGYPVSLTLAVCPTCGAIAPLLDMGICEACKNAKLLNRIDDAQSLVLQLLSGEDRAIYLDTEAEKASRKYDPMPKPTHPLDESNPVEVMRAEDKTLSDLAEWRARLINRELRAAQKRKERMARKAERRGYSIKLDRKANKYYAARAKSENINTETESTLVR